MKKNIHSGWDICQQEKCFEQKTLCLGKSFCEINFALSHMKLTCPSMSSSTVIVEPQESFRFNTIHKFIPLP